MADLHLKVVGQVTKNKSSYFLESIRSSSSSINFVFEYKDQPISNHPLFEANLNYRKGKQLVYLDLVGNDLSQYYDVSNQQFKFDGLVLKLDGKALNSFYSTLEHPSEFLKKIEKNFKKTTSDVEKVSTLIDLIKEPIDKKALLAFNFNGYEPFCNEFVRYFGAKHDKLGKELFEFKDVSNMETFVSKKLDYYSHFTSMSFKDLLGQIKYQSNEEQAQLVTNFKVDSNLSLIKCAKLFDKLNSNKLLPSESNQKSNSTTSQSVVSALTSITYFNSPLDLNFNASSSYLHSITSLIETDSSFPEDWMNDLNKVSNEIESVLKKTAPNKEFANDIGRLTADDKLEDQSVLLKSIVDNRNEQINVNCQPDSTSSKKIYKANDNIFNKREFIVHQHTKMPILDLDKIPKLSEEVTPKKAPPRRNTLKRKTSSLFSSNKIVSQKDKIEEYVKRSDRLKNKKINYKGDSTS